jgi:hypothetical protein
MSNHISKDVKYSCYADHSSSESCGGHTLRIEHHLTSDTVSIWKDGELAYTFDEGEFLAWIAAWESLEQEVDAGPKCVLAKLVGVLNDAPGGDVDRIDHEVCGRLHDAMRAAESILKI